MNKRQILAMATFAMSDGTTAQSSFTLYGAIDTSVVHISMPGQRVTGMASAGRSGSNIGVRGVEDLGNGYKLSFQLESDYKSDGANQDLKFGGQLKLYGAFGEFQMGKLGNMLSDLRDEFSATWGSGIIGFSGSNLLGASAIGSINGSSSWSSPNAIAYRSPTVRGLYGRVGYSFGEQAGNDRLGSNIVTRIGYGQGPVQLSAGYALARGGSDAQGVSYRNLSLGASYKVGGFQPVVLYSTERGAGKRMDAYSAGWRFWRGNHEYLMAYSLFQNKIQNNANSHRLALSYSYALSKRTRIFCSTAYMHNDKNSWRKLGGSLDYSVAGGTNIRGYEIGLYHRF